MIDSAALKDFIRKQLEGTDLFLVDVTVTKDNDIDVEIDGMTTSIDIDDCIRLNDAIEAEFDRDVEDYSLTVGSAGLTSPFRVREQWQKNIGNQVEVLGADGKKYRGSLTEAGDENFTVTVPTKVKKEGEKRPVIEDVPHTFGYDDVKYVKYMLDF